MSHGCVAMRFFERHFGPLRAFSARALKRSFFPRGFTDSQTGGADRHPFGE